MANVEVSFDRIDVDDDGDPGLTDGGGDFYGRSTSTAPASGTGRCPTR
jgi:hypothetical protein